LAEHVRRDELTEREAVRIVGDAFYNTAARLYSLPVIGELLAEEGTKKKHVIEATSKVTRHVVEAE